MISQIILVLVFSSLIVIPSVSAQFVLGGDANQKLVEVTIDKSEIIHVKHIVYSSNNPGNMVTFVGIIEKSLKVTNEEGEEIEFGRNGNDVEGLTGLLILPSNQNSIIEYNLKNVSELNNNLSTVKISYHEKFSILFSEEINLIFVNNNLIEIGDRKGLSINGGGNVNLQYYQNVTKIIKEVEWEENKFDVEIITDSKIEKFSFEQTSKSINFQVNEKNKLITLIMEEELLGGPYVILLNNEKIQYSKLNKENNQVALSMKPESVGQITIIGTTVIPEFSMFIPLIMGFLVVLTVPFMKKFSLH